MSTSWEPLPSIYRSKQEFLASLPPWRRLLQRLNWHPTIDTSVRQYAIEQRLLQMQKEDELLRKEDERMRKEDERMQKEDERLRELDERLRRARRQAQCNRVQLLYQLEPTAAHARQVRDVIALLDEYGGSD